MKLKALVLKRKIDEKNKLLSAVRDRKKELEKRESDLEEAINEASTEEEQTAVEEEVAQFEADKAAADTEEADLEKEIEKLQGELDEEERKQQEAAHTPEPEQTPAPADEARKDEKEMIKRTKTINHDECAKIFSDEKVKNFLGEVRSAIKEKRAITNVGLTIPEVMLPLIEQEVEANSKLLGRVRTETLTGRSREVIQGDYPEAVWTEMCATLNELSLGFNDIEVDGFKVGGYFVICNAILEDNDVNLGNKIVTALGVAIAKAVDKSIPYGKGVKMPLGIITRLAQTAEPDDYPATARTWVDLHTSHIITGTGATGLALFKEIAGHVKLLKNNYYSGGLFWLMNETTHMDLIINSMDANANAAIVAGMSDQMPVVGGDIIELPFMPDNNILVGYGEAFLMVNRKGVQIGQSEHAKFIEDKTVVKGTARYDGKPVIPEAFVLFTITDDAPTTSITFPQDSANP